MEKRPNDEIVFSELLKDPKRLFGLSYIYFLVIGLVLGIYFMLSFNVITRNVIMPVVNVDSAAAVTDIPMVRSSVVPPVDVLKASVPSKEAVAKGQSLFKANCVSCHGEAGLGDGPTAATLNPKPRNFHASVGWKNGRKISNMYKTLQEGIPGSAMASYSYMPPEDRFDLIQYVRTFASDFPTDSKQDLEQLEKTYHLSEGTVTPAQIPIRVAIQKIAAEHRNDTAKASERFAAAWTSDTPGARLLRHIVADPKRAAAGIALLEGRSGEEAMRAVAADPAAFGMHASAALLSPGEWNAAIGAAR